MTSRRVALLAQKRSGRCQQHFVVGAVRQMAVQAAFANRRVTEDKGTALFSMTLKANLIDRVRFKEGIRGTAMRIMAVAASHLALEERHMRTLAEFYALLLMAAKTRIMNRLSA